MTNRMERKRRLERAGWTYYEGGWLPKTHPAGPNFAKQVEMHCEDVAEILAQPAMPRGRPKKEAKE
jgi:hypothetical protein